MKALKFALSFLLAAALLTVPAWAIDLEPGTGSGFYARDTANVLSAETEQMLADYNAVLEKSCDGAQLVVVTVPYLDEDTDVAAAQLMNDWGVGSASDANGTLLLLVTNEHRGWLAIGAGIDDSFTEEMAEQYMEDYFWWDVDKNQFDEAVKKLTAHIYELYLDDLYYQGSAYETQSEPASAAGAGIGAVFGLIVLLLVAVVIFWFLGAASRFSQMRRWGYGGGFFPVFWFGGRRRYRSYQDQFRPQPPPPHPGVGPKRNLYNMHNISAQHMPSSPWGSGLGGFTRGGGAGRSSGPRMGGGGFRGGGGGGHSGGRGAGRR